MSKSTVLSLSFQLVFPVGLAMAYDRIIPIRVKSPVGAKFGEECLLFQFNRQFRLHIQLKVAQPHYSMKLNANLALTLGVLVLNNGKVKK